jgi:Vam6/Vps39-like protein vacuolar protein sorting-associated protein 39
LISFYLFYFFILSLRAADDQTKAKRSLSNLSLSQQPTIGKPAKFNDDIIIDEDEDEILKTLDHVAVCNFLKEQIEPKKLSANLVRIYLQHCIFVWNDKNPDLNNMLIDTYITFIESNQESPVKQQTSSPAAPSSSFSSKSYRQLLLYFLNDTNHYEPNYALSRLNMESYAEERAVVLGKLGKHHEALTIYVNILNDTEKAEAYCEDVYAQANIIDSKQVFYQLLKIYLNSDYEEIRIGASIRLLNAHSNEIGSCRTLELLPAELMKCKNLSNFFENMLNRLVRNKHNTQIINRLMFALELQIHETKIMCQGKKFIVNDEQICKECNKRMGKSAMVRYPNGSLIHYGCLKNSEAFGKPVVK